jgi:DNA polymerase IIIc chi subunit
MKTCLFHDVQSENRERYLFELVEQAYDRRERVVIFTGEPERAVSLDRTLWILKQEAFIPHRVFEKKAERDTEVPIAIVTTEINPVDAGTLIADRHCSIDFARGFDSIHEFVDRSTPDIQEECRKRFRAYRSNKINVEHVKAG